jgi:hypothetical protein
MPNNLIREGNVRTLIFMTFSFTRDVQASEIGFEPCNLRPGDYSVIVDRMFSNTHCREESACVNAPCCHLHIPE